MNLLLVEDSLADAYLVKAILRDARSDIQVDHAENGRVALQRLGLGPQVLPALALIPYGLVLLDVNMPAMGGLDVLRAVQGFPHPPIVVWTSACEICRSGLARELGAEGCRVKPMDIGDLEALLCELADYWLPQAAA